MRKQTDDDSFGGRPLTQAEYTQALRIERKRSRWFWIVMLPAALILSAALIFLVNSACARSLRRACLQELGLDPQYTKANYNGYCMVAYHNHVHGTDIDYFSAEDRRAVSQELEKQMREAYFMGYLYAPENERIDFEPEYTFDQFNQRIQQMWDEVQTRLAAGYSKWIRASWALAAGALALVVLMIAFPGSKRDISGRQLLCRQGILYIPFDSGLGWLMPVRMAVVADDENEPVFSARCRITWWNTPPREAGLLMCQEGTPVLIVASDGRVRYYPRALMNEMKHD